MKGDRRVVIVGAGFGGLEVARSLQGTGAEVWLIDRHNYHTFVPLLYQVVVAQLEPELLAVPIRGLLRRQSQARFVLAQVQRVDLAARGVETDRGQISYDFLVLATGSQAQFLGVPGAADHALPLRTLRDAVNLRHRILSCLEQAVAEPNPVRRQWLLTFAIVGGGTTGVELAGALAEWVRGSLPADYPGLDLRQVRLLLLQGGDRLLPDLPESLGHYTQSQLRRLGVEVYLEAKVSQVTAQGVNLGTGQALSAATVIWTTGVTAAVPEISPSLPRGGKGKLAVQPTLQLPDYPEVYAIGDLAWLTPKTQPLTGVAPEALQQGVAVASNLRRQLRGQAPRAFRYFNKGRLAIIGGYAGVGQIGGWQLKGWLGWVLWLGVHLVYLPSYRNRFLVLCSWLHAYLWGDRAVRLLFPPVNSPGLPAPGLPPTHPNKNFDQS